MHDVATKPIGELAIAVDLDGTLVRTDTLLESILVLIKRDPRTVFLLPLWLTRGIAGFKREIAHRVNLSVDLLPLCDLLVSYLKEQRERGRTLILATAADRSIADAVQARLKLFDRVLASDGQLNLKGGRKLEALRDAVGGEFVYAGDSSADLPIWRGTRRAILVGASPRIVSTVRSCCEVEAEFPNLRAGFDAWLRAIRIHQWVKNALLFVPLLTSFSFEDLGRVTGVVLGFFAFSMLASATYILNDLLDLENDRLHPRKKTRPFASGLIPIASGVKTSALLFIASMLTTLALPAAFFVVLLIYLATTLAYSFVLKEFVLLDVLALAVLYTIRIVAGAVCIGSIVSSWLLAFSVFMFFSLALVKRCSELVTLDSAGRSASHGRDYRVSDLVILWPVGVGASLCSTVIFGLFINSPETASRYAAPQLLWLAALGLLYWLARLWIKTARGEMHDDPVVFALKNRGSRQTILGIVIAVLAAHFLPVDSL